MTIITHQLYFPPQHLEEAKMALASTPKIVLGSFSFTIFWILAVFPSVPFLPIGRTAGSLLGAMLVVLFRVISPEDAYASIDLQVLGLLFGTMVVSIFLEKADMFKYLANLLAYKSWGSKDLLCRVCLVSAFSSALFTNDTSCVVLTEFILKIARQHNLPPQPFLLALASSANIGSSATPIGNPQNLIIAVQSKISFGKFLFGLFPAMLVGVVVNYCILLCYFWKVLSIEKDVEIAITGVNGGNENDNDNDDGDDVSLHRFSPATMSHVSSVNSRNWSGNIQVEDSDTMNDSISRHFWNQEKWRRLTWKICVYLVTLGMLISFLMGLNMSWTAITAALALVVLDFKDAKPCLEKVSYSLLIFFCGMFITISGLNKTGIPSAFWDFIEPHAQIDTARGLTILTLVILVLSNVASNVPTVLLLGARVAASASTISASEATKAWLILAWVSTVAGNLSLLGSAANLIVCEQARHAHYCSYNLSFWSHLRFGMPSTFIVIAIGLLIVRSY